MTSSVLKYAIALISTLTIALQAMALNGAEHPSNAQVGQCFAKVLTPDTTETALERVEITPATSRRVIVPAVYEKQVIRVKVREATTEYHAVPAEYETITEQMLIKPSQQIFLTIPAQYEIWTETVEVKPARAVWKSGKGLYGRGMAGTGTASEKNVTASVLCRVTEPAITKIVRHTRIVTPARPVMRIIAAQYKTVTRQVVRTPARIESVSVPAEYLDIPVNVMIRAETTITEAVPAVYKMIERQVIKTTGRLIWAEVLCDTNSNPQIMADIQVELTKAGFPTKVDGIYGPKTQAAMEQYQRANDLTAGFMTVDTVRALNLNPYALPELMHASQEPAPIFADTPTLHMTSMPSIPMRGAVVPLLW